MRGPHRQGPRASVGAALERATPITLRSPIWVRITNRNDGQKPRFHCTYVFPSRSRGRRYVEAGDDGLDAISRKLLNQIDELKRLELEWHRAPRDSDEFNDLASKVERLSRDVFATAELAKPTARASVRVVVRERTLA